MVAIGSKALPLGRHKLRCLAEDTSIAVEEIFYNHGEKKRNMGRKATKKHSGSHRDRSVKGLSGRVADDMVKVRKISKQEKDSVHQSSFVRKQVDPETARYFAEIANVIEGNEIELEERSVICGNALEEARGKEVELATDYIISHTLQTLLEGCSVNDLCGFLRSSATNFSQIAMDRSGSHVAETALKSLSVHLQDSETHSLVEEALAKICQAVVVNPVDIMCNCYGSHVLRSLLRLCKGVPLEEFRAGRSSKILAERLNFRLHQGEGNDLPSYDHRFPNLFKYLVSEILNAAGGKMSMLQVNQYGSLVFQTALKLLVGDEEELLRTIQILLGCNMENSVGGNLVEVMQIQNISSLVQENAYSHLMEVILEVAPDTLYNELLEKVFRNSLFEMSSDHSGNFVVQALVSHAKCQDHMELIWEELGKRLKDLLEMGRSGVVASIFAASQRLHSYEHKCCQALAAAVCLKNESDCCIVPRILFLDNFLYCEDKSSWIWPNGVKMHVVGSLILQSVFRLPSELIQPFVTSITLLEDNHVLEASKDASGSRVIEAFLSSGVSGKQKRKLIVKLRGHFGELSMHPSGSFTVDKCFDASNVSMRETIVSELLPFQTELSKTKQGPYLLRKFDVDGFAKRPEQWKSRQTSKQCAYKEFYAAFGPAESNSSKRQSFLADTHHKSQPEKLKEMRKEIETSLASAVAPTSGSQLLSHKFSKNKSRKSGLTLPSEGAGFTKHSMGAGLFKEKNRKHKKKMESDGVVNESAGETFQRVQLSKSVDKKEKKRHREDGMPEPMLKKKKAVQ